MFVSLCCFASRMVRLPGESQKFVLISPKYRLVQLDIYIEEDVV